MIRLGVSADTKADLVGFNSAVDRQGYIVMGDTIEGDGNPRFYYYDVSSSTTPDGENILVATGMSGMGRYIKTSQIPVVSVAGLSGSYNDLINKPSIPNDYFNTANIAGGGGQAVFYLTSDKTSTGTALYSTIDAVIPIINDATANYTYGWSYNPTTKALTVTAKTNLTAVITLLTVILGPTNVTNGTAIQVIVKGH